VNALITRARGAGKRLMIGAISGDAAASPRFHRRMGFAEVGRISGAGQKFGRVLDLILVARSLGER